MTSYARATKALNLGAVRLLDLMLVVVGFVVSYWIREHLDQPTGIRSMFDLLPESKVPVLVAPLYAYWWLIFLTALYWPYLLDQQRFYHQPAHLSIKRASWIVLKTGLLILAGQLSLLFLFRIPWVNRTYLLGAMVLTGVFLCLRHGLYRALFPKGRSVETWGYPVLLVTSSQEAAGLVDWLKGYPEEYYLPSGIILTDLEASGLQGQSVRGVPVCGGIDQLIRCMHEQSVSSVVVGGGGFSLDLVRLVVEACETEGVDAWVLADFVKTKTAKAVTSLLANREALLFTATTGSEWQKAFKRIMDIVGAFALISLFSPVMLVLAVVIKLASPGPVLFRQARCGLHGNPFTMLKFRSMTTDAEMRKSELEAFNEMTGPVFKVSNDPRITRVGRLLRRWSLDELPQLFNVLAGHMSLVGPRPLPVYEVNRFDDLSHRRRLSMKPGLTCLWQIRGRNQVRDFNDWVRMDLEYIDRWSLWLDFQILVQTPWVVLKGGGV